MYDLQQYLIIGILVLFIIFSFLYIGIDHSNLEQFGSFIPWSMGTRFYPTYDIRGYPYISPWNYPYAGYPFLYFSPYFYEANGKYLKDKRFSKLLNETQDKILEIVKSNKKEEEN